jgi:hypothetical protein
MSTALSTQSRAWALTITSGLSDRNSLLAANLNLDFTLWLLERDNFLPELEIDGEISNRAWCASQVMYMLLPV